MRGRAVRRGGSALRAVAHAQVGRDVAQGHGEGRHRTQPGVDQHHHHHEHIARVDVVRADVVRGRFRAGDSIEALAEDYGLSSEQIQDVFRSEMPVAA